MIPAMRDGWRWRGGLLLAVLGVVAAGTTPRAHDLERTTAHLTLAADGSFALRLAHDPAWLVLRLEGFAGAPGAASTTDPAARDARLREWAPLMIDRVVLFVDGHEVRPAVGRLRAATGGGAGRPVRARFLHAARPDAGGRAHAALVPTAWSSIPIRSR